METTSTARLGSPYAAFAGHVREMSSPKSLQATVVQTIGKATARTLSSVQALARTLGPGLSVQQSVMRDLESAVFRPEAYRSLQATIAEPGASTSVQALVAETLGLLNATAWHPAVSIEDLTEADDLRWLGPTVLENGVTVLTLVMLLSFWVSEMNAQGVYIPDQSRWDIIQAISWCLGGAISARAVTKRSAERLRDR